jgi:3',5'-cyclic AMP phosphodiesterase CpdA
VRLLNVHNPIKDERLSPTRVAAYNANQGNLLKRLVQIGLLTVSLTFLACSNIVIQESEEDWSFVVFGDLREGFGIYAKLVAYMSRINPEPFFAICVGDIMRISSTEPEWKRFMLYSKPLTDKFPLYIARGNHEGNDPYSESLCRSFMGIKQEDPFYYSTTYRNCALIILDTETPGEEGSIVNTQLTWLKSQLTYFSSDSNCAHIFIAMHRPLYPQGAHAGENLANADELHRLFESHPKIKAVLAGHDHMFNYYTLDGIPYIETGGAGVTLNSGYGGEYHHFVKIAFFESEARIHLSTIGIFNEVIDNYDL